ncbi:MAG: sigma-70 family RNA polymerase sigma factor [Clostridiales bacterium]|nr:sigma-70 family RNA polymerase sigma factor [Clostridiales bacterium]
MNNISSLSLKTLLFSVKEENSDLSSVTKTELINRYGKTAADIVCEILSGKSSEQGFFKQLSEIDEIGQPEKLELISMVVLCHEETRIPMDVIMELFRSDNEILKIAAKTITVKQYTDFVRYIIHRNYPTYAEKYFDDLFNSGICGLLISLETYDESRYSFTTYSKKYVIHEISQQINFYRNDSSPHYNKLQKTIKAAIDRLENEGLEPTEQRISIITELKPNVIRREMGYIETTRFRYLDDENDTSLTEIESGYDVSPEAIAERNEKNTSLLKSLERLPELERSVLVLKYSGCYTNDEIAKMLRISINEVKALSHKGLYHMKRDPFLLKTFPEYKNEAEEEMKKYVIPILPTQEEIEAGLEALLNADGFPDFQDTEFASAIW